MVSSGESVMVGIVGQGSSNEQLSSSSSTSDYTTGSDGTMDFNSGNSGPEKGDGDSSGEDHEVMIRHLSKQIMIKDRKIQDLEVVMNLGVKT